MKIYFCGLVKVVVTQPLTLQVTEMMALYMGAHNGLLTKVNSHQASSSKAWQVFIEVPNVIAERGCLTFWFKPDWDGEDPMDYRIFDASFPPIYFFIGKGASERDITPAEFGFYFEAADDTDWQDVEFDPADIIEKNKWFHVAVTWDFVGGDPFPIHWRRSGSNQRHKDYWRLSTTL